MNKIVSLLLALMLCLTGAAFAEGSPSIQAGDLYEVTINVEVAEGEEAPFILPIDVETMTEEELVAYEETLEICEAEVEKLLAAESVQSYFGKVMDVNTYLNRDDIENIEYVDLYELLQEQLAALPEGTLTDRENPSDDLNVFEFLPVVIGGFTEEHGIIEVVMSFPTIYEENEPVLVLFSMTVPAEDDPATEDVVETEELLWIVAEGVGQKDGGILIELPAELLVELQENNAMMAAVSRP